MSGPIRKAQGTNRRSRTRYCFHPWRSRPRYLAVRRSAQLLLGSLDAQGLRAPGCDARSPSRFRAAEQHPTWLRPRWCSPPCVRAAEVAQVLSPSASPLLALLRILVSRVTEIKRYGFDAPATMVVRLTATTL